MDCTHGHCCEERKATPISPQTTEFLLLCHYTEYTDWSYICLVWNSSCRDQRALQRVVRSAERTMGTPLPPLQDLYTRCCSSRARRIIKDPHHPGNRLFVTLRSGWEKSSTGQSEPWIHTTTPPPHLVFFISIYNILHIHTLSFLCVYILVKINFVFYWYFKHRNTVCHTDISLHILYEYVIKTFESWIFL